MIPNDKKPFTFDEAFEAYQLALTYKALGNYDKSIEILRKTKDKLYNTTKSLELAMLSILKDEIQIILEKIKKES